LILVLCFLNWKAYGKIYKHKNRVVLASVLKEKKIATMVISFILSPISFLKRKFKKVYLVITTLFYSSRVDGIL
jgi:hypothetical protein